MRARGWFDNLGIWCEKLKNLRGLHKYWTNRLIYFTKYSRSHDIMFKIVLGSSMYRERNLLIIPRSSFSEKTIVWTTFRRVYNVCLLIVCIARVNSILLNCNFIDANMQYAIFILSLLSKNRIRDACFESRRYAHIACRFGLVGNTVNGS